MKKNFLRGAIALITVIAIVISASSVLILKSEDGISQMESLYKQKKDSIDVLFLGSSRIFCNVRTGVLWDEYGIAAYDLGGAETPTWSSYYHLKEALKTQHPKVIVYEISSPVVRPGLYPPIFWVQDNVYGMKWNMNRIKSMKMQVYENNFKKGLVPLSAMHDRYKELVENDFVDKNNNIDYKGFDEREGVTPFDAPNVSHVTERTAISEQSEEYLRLIIDACAEENIPLMFMLAPYVPSEEEQAMYNYIHDIADENGVEYIDFSSSYQDFGLDYSSDMADEFHLNSSGSTKFSSYLGKCLTDRYELTDRRGDADYSSWEIDATRQRQQVNEVLLGTIEEDGKYFLNLINDEYLVYVSLGSGAEWSENLNNNKNVLNRLGLKPEFFISGGVFILSKGEAIYGSADSNQRAHINQGSTDLLLLRESGDDDAAHTTLYVNRKSYDLTTEGIKVVVYDKSLDRIVTERELSL